MVDVCVSSMDSHKDTRFALLLLYSCHASGAAGARGTCNSPKASRQHRGNMEWKRLWQRCKARVALVVNHLGLEGFACWLSATKSRLNAPTKVPTCTLHFAGSAAALVGATPCAQVFRNGPLSSSAAG